MKNSFPIEIRKKSALVKIVYTPRHGKPWFTVVHHDAGGQRQRKVLRQLDDAREFAEATATALSNGALSVLPLSGAARYAYERATGLLQSVGVPLDVAVIQFVEATKALQGGTLTEAVQFFIKHDQRKLPVKTVAEVVAELLEDRRANGVSKLHLRDLRIRLGHFSKAFSCPIASVTPKEIGDFLNSMKVAARTRHNHRTTIATLLSFGKSQGYLPADHPGVAKSLKSATTVGNVEIFTCKEMAALLNAAEAEVIPALAIGAFAGVRSEELRRMDWDAVKLDRGFIEIKASNAKLKTRRLIIICPALRHWLLPHVQPSGPVFKFQNLTNQFQKTATRAGIQWKKNGLRHSWVSRRVALIKNIAEVALEAGNSPQVIRTNYLEVTTEEEAKAWFAIVPATSSTSPLPPSEAALPTSCV
jgi:integrase